MRTTTRKATVHIDAPLHRALRQKALCAERTISDLAGEAIRRALCEDSQDLAAFEQREHEKSIPFDQVVAKLKRRGKI